MPLTPKLVILLTFPTLSPFLPSCSACLPSFLLSLPLPPFHRLPNATLLFPAIPTVYIALSVMVEDDETNLGGRKFTKLSRFKCQNELTARKVNYLLLKHNLLFVVVTGLYLLFLPFPTPIGLTVDKLC